MSNVCADRGRWPDSPILCTLAAGHFGAHSCVTVWLSDGPPDGERITDVVGDELEHGTDDEAAK